VNKKDAIELRRMNWKQGHVVDPNKMTHHLLFAAISLSSKFNIKTFYEIGTCAGNGARMWSLMFPNTHIKTLDLVNGGHIDNTEAQERLKGFNNVEMVYHN